MSNRYSFLLMVGVFLAAYYIPWSEPIILSTIAGMVYGVLVG
jgi:hypothetical protein